MRLVIETDDVRLSDDTIVTYVVKANNRIITRGSSKAKELPKNIEESCDYCEYFDGEYCLFADPKPIIHKGGECPHRSER